VFLENILETISKIKDISRGKPSYLLLGNTVRYFIEDQTQQVK
jgi:hypothetical protein